MRRILQRRYFTTFTENIHPSDILRTLEKNKSHQENNTEIINQVLRAPKYEVVQFFIDISKFSFSKYNNNDTIRDIFEESLLKFNKQLQKNSVQDSLMEYIGPFQSKLLFNISDDEKDKKTRASLLLKFMSTLDERQSFEMFSRLSSTLKENVLRFETKLNEKQSENILDYLSIVVGTCEKEMKNLVDIFELVFNLFRNDIDALSLPNKVKYKSLIKRLIEFALVPSEYQSELIQLSSKVHKGVLLDLISSEPKESEVSRFILKKLHIYN